MIDEDTLACCRKMTEGFVSRHDEGSFSEYCTSFAANASLLFRDSVCFGKDTHHGHDVVNPLRSCIFSRKYSLSLELAYGVPTLF